jgi:hypothetical protein
VCNHIDGLRRLGSSRPSALRLHTGEGVGIVCSAPMGASPGRYGLVRYALASVVDQAPCVRRSTFGEPRAARSAPGLRPFTKGPYSVLAPGMLNAAASPSSSTTAGLRDLT